MSQLSGSKYLVEIHHLLIFMQFTCD